MTDDDVPGPFQDIEDEAIITITLSPRRAAMVSLAVKMMAKEVLRLFPEEPATDPVLSHALAIRTLIAEAALTAATPIGFADNVEDELENFLGPQT